MRERPRGALTAATFLGGVVLGALVGGVVARLVAERAPEVARGPAEPAPAAPSARATRESAGEPAPWDLLLSELSGIRHELARWNAAPPATPVSSRTPLDGELSSRGLEERLDALTRAIDRLASAGPTSRPSPTLLTASGPRPELDDMLAQIQRLYVDGTDADQESFRERFRRDFLFRDYEEVLKRLGRPDEVYAEDSSVTWHYERPSTRDENDLVSLSLVFHDGLAIRVDF